jgi:hypothetical protein
MDVSSKIRIRIKIKSKIKIKNQGRNPRGCAGFHPGLRSADELEG